METFKGYIDGKEYTTMAEYKIAVSQLDWSKKHVISTNVDDTEQEAKNLQDLQDAIATLESKIDAAEAEVLKAQAEFIKTIEEYTEIVEQVSPKLEELKAQLEEITDSDDQDETARAIEALNILMNLGKYIKLN